jgi:2-polyprenyl-6-hydroxyphenyl methylase/3-demethylubiquinone-9 3-methyltransferase
MLKKDEFRGRGDQGAGSTASAEEVAKFERQAREWRDPDGRFRSVHAFNAARIPLLLRELPARLALAAGDPAKPLAGVKIADIGCATGLVSEAMARAGAEVLAVDAAAGNIAIARAAAAQAGLAIDYRVALPEQLAEEAGRLDAVLCLEVVEHVGDLDAFLAASARLVRPGGLMVVATLNRTLESFAKAILGAEYVLRLLPKGTHDWRAFVRPEELRGKLAGLGLREEAIFGLELDPLAWRWRVTRRTGVNYLACFRRS